METFTIACTACDYVFGQVSLVPDPQRPGHLHYEAATVIPTKCPVCNGSLKRS